MDIQKMMDAASAAMRNSRKPYHVSLGDLLALAQANPDSVFIIDEEQGGITHEHSYRGYYDDLAFELSDTATPADTVVEMCLRAGKETYSGYKGGDYRYAPDTPLWLAACGCTGEAIVAFDTSESGLIRLITRKVD